MAWGVKVVADSVSPSGHRLSSIECSFPNIVAPELLKHRAFSIGSASNRAVPNSVIAERVACDPFIPLAWPKRHRDMQPQEYFTDPETISLLRNTWIEARNVALKLAETLTVAGVHKEIANRPLGPYQWVTVLITATDWDNFFKLRCHPAAEQHMRHLAELIRDARDASQPKGLFPGEWHLPYIDEDDWNLSISQKKKVSVARCARVSTLTQDGKRDVVKDFELFQRLYEAEPRHSVPFEMVATPVPGRHANFDGWMSYRWQLEHAA